VTPAFAKTAESDFFERLIVAARLSNRSDARSGNFIPSDTQLSKSGRNSPLRSAASSGKPASNRSGESPASVVAALRGWSM